MSGRKDMGVEQVHGCLSGGIEVGVVKKIEFHIGLQDCRVLVVQSSPVQSSPVQSSPVQSSPVQSSPVQVPGPSPVILPTV